MVGEAKNVIGNMKYKRLDGLDILRWPNAIDMLREADSTYLRPLIGCSQFAVRSSQFAVRSSLLALGVGKVY
jgi:hypothetical protein